MENAAKAKRNHLSPGARESTKPPPRPPGLDATDQL